MGAIIAHRENDLQEFAHCLKSLTGMLDRCCHDDSLPDELLYGRAGYLYSLLLVRKYCGDSSIPDSILEKVSQSFDVDLSVFYSFKILRILIYCSYI